jgi:hypothetical protein
MIAKENEGRHRFRERPFGSVTPGFYRSARWSINHPEFYMFIDEHGGGV